MNVVKNLKSVFHNAGSVCNIFLFFTIPPTCIFITIFQVYKMYNKQSIERCSKLCKYIVSYMASISSAWMKWTTTAFNDGTL